MPRRSVDWRDSGIVIDDDPPFSSIEGISDYIESQATSICYPPEKTDCDQDDDGDTILHIAVVGCSLDKVRDLLRICDLDNINNMMQTPLHVATLANRPEVVKLLIDSGKAKLNVHDRRGNTPLHLACQKGFRDIAINILNCIVSGTVNSNLTLKQHLETTNFDGQTSLHMAAIHDQRDIIELLVNEFNADLNCSDSRSGETILHKAIGMFNVDLVAFILRLKQHCNRADYYGRKPSDTIRLLLESRTDRTDELFAIENLVKNRIECCIKSNGCCTVGEQLENNTLVSTSSSDYSDSDSDIN